jgi:hypothetical protein
MPRTMSLLAFAAATVAAISTPSGGTSLIDDRGDAGMHPDHVGLEPEAARDVLVDVGMRIDHSGKHQLARDIDDCASRASENSIFDRRDGSVADADVLDAVDARGRRDHPAAAQDEIKAPTVVHSPSSRGVAHAMQICGRLRIRARNPEFPREAVGAGAIALLQPVDLSDEARRAEPGRRPRLQHRSATGLAEYREAPFMRTGLGRGTYGNWRLPSARAQMAYYIACALPLRASRQIRFSRKKLSGEARPCSRAEAIGARKPQHARA